MRLSYHQILRVLEDFYQRANHDIMIGYHFRKIQDFATHIPRIADFWELQLYGQKQMRKASSLPFDLIQMHRPLQIRRGQVGRWVQLFTQTLEAHSEQLDSTEREKWIQKVKHFESVFLRSKELFIQAKKN